MKSIPLICTPLIRRATVALICSVLNLGLAISSAIGATITTDKLDYPPGDTAFITGNDWAPNEEVTLVVTHADGTPDTGEDHLPWTVTADTNGYFTTTWH